MIAHRGASGYAPENTLAAFDLAVEMKADYIEFDLQMSKDGELVVIHDDSIDRTTDGSGRIGDLTYEEILQFDAGSWFHLQFSGQKVPSLTQVLERYAGEIGLLIELKEPDRYEDIELKLADALEVYLDIEAERHPIVVQSFDLPSLLLFHEYSPRVPVGIVITDSTFEGEEQLTEYAEYVDFVSPKKSVLNDRFIKKTKMLDLELYPWTVKNQEVFQWVYQIKVNGIITDFPNYEQKSPLQQNTIIVGLLILLVLPLGMTITLSILLSKGNTLITKLMKFCLKP